jgi:drug/metabolite transporter (DMT)-like permease
VRWKSDLTLLFVAAVWGSGFVAQRLATMQLSTSYFNGGRFLLAALLLLGIALFQRGKPQVTRAELPWMILAGTLLFAAAWLQQAGLETTTIGNASFITGLYVVLVPLILLIFLKRRVSWLSWVAVFLAALGVMLLSLQEEFRLAPGDALELAGAVLWALHVILIGRLASQGANVLWFSVIQFGICGLLNFLLAFGMEPGGVGSLVAAWPVFCQLASVSPCKLPGRSMLQRSMRRLY